MVQVIIIFRFNTYIHIFLFIFVIKVPSLNQRKFFLEHNLLTLFDMGFFEPSALRGGGGVDEGPIIALCYYSDDHKIWHRYQA